jgi:hypothetical protein
MSEYTVFVRDSDESDWTEHSKHPDRDAAFAALRATLISDEDPWSTAKLEPGGELFMRQPHGAVVEVMSD